MTVMGLTRAPNATIEGHVRLDGEDLLTASSDELRRIRGKRIAMIFQDPLSSLHPFYKVGWQIIEEIRAHEDVSKNVAEQMALDALQEVRIPSAAERLQSYPHELSGGMRQRVMIAMALVLDPEVLIADEPTTALDVTVQAQILELIHALQEERGTAVILITHDLGVVAQMADEVAVMYAGHVVERAPLDRVLDAPEHPYTWGLLRSLPRPDLPRKTRLEPIQGQPPSLIRVPSGCPFHPRCPYAFDVCHDVVPALLDTAPRHAVACHLAPAERRRIGRQISSRAAA